MNLPPEFGMVFISILLGLLCVYLYKLDKKGKKLKETEAGRREYYEKYTPNFIKKKHEKMGLVSYDTDSSITKKQKKKAKDKNKI
ncbi:MAG: hypothetical protein ACRC57_08505 [Sarcina sp.]